MEPISLIIAALIAGATAAAKDTAEKGVKDAYEGLKALIKNKFKDDTFGQAMVDAKPEDIKQTEGLLKDKITKAGVDKDENIVKAAEELMKKEDPEGTTAGKYNISVGRDIKGIVGDISGGIINQDIK